MEAHPGKLETAQDIGLGRVQVRGHRTETPNILYHLMGSYPDKDVGKGRSWCGRSEQQA